MTAEDIRIILPEVAGPALDVHRLGMRNDFGPPRARPFEVGRSRMEVVADPGRWSCAGESVAAEARGDTHGKPRRRLFPEPRGIRERILFEQGLVFKGGTCLSKVHAEFFRLSEDLDFCISVRPDATPSDRRQAASPIKVHFAGVQARLP